MRRECRQTSSFLYLFIDGEASTLVHWQVRRHIDVCPECHRRFEFERRLKAIIERACQCVGCPDGFEERLRAALMREFE